MIFLLEVPVSGKAHCWFAYDREDFIRRAYINKQSSGATLFATATARHLLTQRGLSPEHPEALLREPDVCALGEEYGWDCTLFRADFLSEPGQYQADPIDEFAACIAACIDGLHDWRIYLDDEQALDALDSDSIFKGRDGYIPYMALHQQLVALDLIADNF